MSTQLSLDDYDRLCNEGFAELDKLREADMVKSPEYGEVLKKLQKLTKERLVAAGLQPVSLR